MKLEKETEEGIFKLKFSSNIVDVQMKNIFIINQMFEDHEYSETKLQGFKKLAGIEHDLDNVHLYVLARLVASDFPRRITSCEFFELPPLIISRVLSELEDFGYIDEVTDDDFDGSDSKIYRISDSFWAKLSGKNTNINNTLKKKIKSKYLIESDKIKKVDLYYSDELSKTLENVKKILDENNLKGIKERILEENQHAGICISFYGSSGTGKTEKVLQLCKDAKRDIFSYNIADSESRYCGEKQKAVNMMFTDFKKISEKYKTMGLPEPVLLLNEADALFSKRHDETDVNNTANRENNQLQAELLNHIENFDGLLFITTNKIQNFDEAMERRFLYKIKFDNPTVDTQKAIWKNKFPSLSDDDINTVVGKYSSFTGGNIQNIKKKASIDYIIDGKKANVTKILELCKNEKIENENQRKIGFC